MIHGVSLVNGYAKGGDGGFGGGGGGLGAGGAIFINRGAVSVQNVHFGNNAAVGGKGGSADSGSRGGGGGGLGGNGGDGSGGAAAGGGGGFMGHGGHGNRGFGGGGGFQGNGGNGLPTATGAYYIVGGGGGGRTAHGADGQIYYLDSLGGQPLPSHVGAVWRIHQGGEGGGTQGGTGSGARYNMATGAYSAGTMTDGGHGTTGGGGGGGYPLGGNGGRFGGGGGSGYGNGGEGGAFGGGGGTSSNHPDAAAGNGGFGGGGGGGFTDLVGYGARGGNGGFGGGAGGAYNASAVGTPGLLGGAAGGETTWGWKTTIGGGGGAAGGAIFVRGGNGGSLTFIDSGLSNGSATGGAGGDYLAWDAIHGRGQSGTGVGSGIFLYGGTANLQINSGTTTVADTIADSAFQGGLASGIRKTGNGTLALTGLNHYGGATHVDGGTLSVATLADGSLVSGIGSSSADAENLQLNGGTLAYTGGSVRINRGFRLDANGGGIRVTHAATELTFTGSAIGSGWLDKSGAGTLSYTGNGAFNGGLNVREGTFQLKESGSLTTHAASGVSGGATLRVSGSTATWTNGADVYVGLSGSGNGSLLIENGGKLANTYALLGRPGGSGSALVTGPGSRWTNSGDLVLGLEGGGTGSLTVSDGAEVIVGAQLILGRDAGDSGSVVLSGSEGNRSVLQVAKAWRGSGNASFSWDGGIVRASAHEGNLFSGFTAGQMVLGSHNGYFDNAGYNVTLAAPLSGTGTLIKQGAGELTLTGASTHQGGTRIEMGVLSISSDANLGAAGGDIHIGPAELKITGTFASSRRVVLDPYATVTVESGTWTQNGTFEGALSKWGAGTLQLGQGGSQSLTGVNVRQGTLLLGRASSASVHAIGAGGTTDLTVHTGAIVALGGTGGDQIAQNAQIVLHAGSTFDLAGRSEGFDRLTGSGTATNNAASTTGTLTLGENHGSFVLEGVVTDGAGKTAFAKTGTGTVTLSANNTYTGSTSVHAGTLRLEGNTRSASAAIASGATLEIHKLVETHYNSIVFTGNGTLAKTGSGVARWSESTASFQLGSGALIDVREGIMLGGSHANEDWTQNKANLNVAAGAIFRGVEANIRVNALTGAGRIESGYPGSGYSHFTFGVDHGSGTFSGELTDGPLFAGRFTKEGKGRQVLSGSNSYTGRLMVLEGILEIAHSHGLGSGGTGTTVETGGTLQITNVHVANESLLTLSGEGADRVGALLATGNSAIGSHIMIVDAASVRVAEGGTLTLSSFITGGTLVKTGAGRLTLDAVGLYHEATLLLEGELFVSTGSAFGGGSISVEGGKLTLASGVTTGQPITLNGGVLNQEVNGDLANAVNVSRTRDGVTTSAKLLAGQSGPGTLSASFSSSSAAGNDQLRTGDVYSLHGTGEDVFVLELSVSTARRGTLGWLEVETNLWTLAVNGNVGNNATLAMRNYHGSFADFQSEFGTDLASYLGAFGSDENGSVWAVLNHNSDFAVIPEPGSLAMLLSGGVALWWMARRRTGRATT